MEVMTFNVDKDRRNLTDDTQNFDIDFSDSKYSWLAARQYENQMRQVQLNIQHGDGSPLDLTGANVVFEGLLPDGEHRIIDAKHSTILDAVNGQARFDFPAQAFTVSGSYKQAFFRVYRNGMNVASLEFSLEVYADKVISGLIPADYITPFLDLYGQLSDVVANATGDLKVALQAWQEKFQAALTQWNGNYADLMVTVNKVDSQLNSLSTQIKANDLVTATDLDHWESKMDDLVNGQVEVDESVDIGGQLPATLKKQLDAFKAKLPTTGLNIAMVTDAHYEDRPDENTWGAYPYSRDAYQHLTALNYLQDAVDVVIANGDNINGLDLNVLSSKLEQSMYADKILTGVTQADSYMILGNHDDGSTVLNRNPGGITLDQVISTAEFEEMYQTSDLLNGEVRDNGSLYFYKDYADKKVRLIGLNSVDVPYDEVDGDGHVVNTRWLLYGYSQQQLNWLARIALSSVPAGYSVLVVSHLPLYYGWTTDPKTEFNSELVKGLLDAVALGQSYNATSDADVPTAMRSTITADYSAQGSRPVAGFLCGHVHKEMTVNLDHFTMQTLTCDVNQDGKVALDDANAMAIYVYNIDSDGKKVTSYGFGRASDRSYTY
ncbi:BppU family phage baseplate upper protein [Lactiplantibacillus mudanjiangensis]|uniref:Calcineurin-like phosphoesterase domain-containing protein n=1 Tax=Lactiplantibacillus mudanjiangensis TaxID=1296538 RepID=A0A660E6E9_9LACO|nr:BppU family phage baseplate upper protein [Lactiplantibacillus mudanjiangensis]VDG26338.1 hypothetical protein [Lactobacillus plantarum] [Lactiplantibacillus mudanjiangensis]VDG27862.1 hypothetical protein [Lactobacillus plantarum] [Lactiplantibacillus mudanjiangensis]